MAGDGNPRQPGSPVKLTGWSRAVAGTVVHMSDRPTRVLTWEQWGEMTRDLAPPTDDDVSITKDGRRLDTAEKVIEFFAELDAEREGRSTPGA